MEYKNLRKLMVDKDTNCRQLARDLGIPEPTFYNKINGKSDFTRQEIERIIKFLKIDKFNIADYFFDL